MFDSVLGETQDERAKPAAPAARRPIRRSAAAAFAALVFVFTSTVSLAAVPPEGFADLVERVKPAVVNVSTTLRGPGAVRGRGGQQFQIPPELRGTPFEDFLRRFFNQRGGGGGGGDDEDNNNESGRGGMALGSGFIIDPAGYVVTNNHVIQNADKIQVTLSDGRKLDAKLVGRDDKTDIALLKVETSQPLPAVKWGDSEKARVGDWVIAVGNPFGLGGTVTAGIISARGRDIQSGPFDDYLQIDASINRGNSGGPSFDRNGEVIGINTAIYSPSGGSIGIGFAIPSSMAKPIVDQLRERGRIDRGWLGVSIQPVTKEIADSLGMDEPKGALIAGVNNGSPAAKAGLKQGDVVRTVNGQPVDQFRDLARLIAAAGPNKTVDLGVWRNGRQVPVQVALGRMPADQKAAATDEDENAPTPRAEPAKPTSVLGLSLAPINRQTRQRYDLPEDIKGAVILDVKSGSAAADAGFTSGDIIVKVGEKTVSSPRDVADAVQAASKEKRKAVLFLIQRGSNQRFVALPVGTSAG